MSEIIGFLNQNWLTILLVIWVILALANKSRRDETHDKLANFITRPIVYRDPTGSDGHPIYSNEELRAIARHVAEVMIAPIENWVVRVGAWFSKRWALVVNQEQWPMRPFGYLIQFVALLLFLWADGIAIANALDAINLLDEVPEWLRSYEWAAALGSIVPIIVGALIANEVTGRSDFTDWGDQPESLWKWFGRVTTGFVIVAGIVGVLALGLARFRVMVELPIEFDRPLEQWFVFPVILVLVPINAALAAMLIHREALKGFQIMMLILGEVLLLAPRAVLQLAKMLGAMGVFGLDLVLRVMLVVVYVSAFIVITPLDAFTALLAAPLQRVK